MVISISPQGEITLNTGYIVLVFECRTMEKIQTRGNLSAIYCQKNVYLSFLLTFFLCSPVKYSAFFTSSRTAGAYEEMRCAHLGFPRALQVSRCHQGKCRFETPALPQRPVTAFSILCDTAFTHTHTTHTHTHTHTHTPTHTQTHTHTHTRTKEV